MLIRTSAAIAAAGLTLAATAAPLPVETRDSQLRDAVNQTLHVTDHTLQSLVPTMTGEGTSVVVTLDGVRQPITLTPYSLRTADFVLLSANDKGDLVPTDIGAPRTVRGAIDGMIGTLVAGSILDDGVYLTISMPDGSRYWVEPVASRLGLVDSTVHAVYRGTDVLPGTGTCGLAHDVIEAGGDDLAAAGGPLAGAGVLSLAELATDADYEFFLDYGTVGAAQDRIELIMNTVNVQYELEVEITHFLTASIVRSNSNDPYTLTGPQDRLCQFITEWTNNQQGIQRDVAQLFTGAEIDGSVIGIASDIGGTGICVNQGACTGGTYGPIGSYCMSQSDFNGNFSCATDLSAHELGHLWGAFHCSCPSNTMNPSITCANTFSGGTQSSISAYAATRDCLDTGVLFSYPSGRPEIIDPDGGTTIRVRIEPLVLTPVPGSAILAVDTGSGFSVTPMTLVSTNTYDGVFPASACPTTVKYYIGVQTVEGPSLTDPPSAPATFFETLAADGFATIVSDNFETNNGWTVSNSAGLTDGQWTRGTPVGGGVRGDPPTDADGSGQCWLTDNVSGNSDVDGGSTTLTSPNYDVSSGDAIVSYARWYHNSFGAEPFTETFVVQVSGNGGSTWQNLETVGPGGPEVSGGWINKSFVLSEVGIAPTTQFRIRFTADDFDPGAVVEAGVDAFAIEVIECVTADPCPADVNDSGAVDFDDLVSLLASWGPCGGCAEDIDESGSVDFDDLVALLAAWGPCP